MRRFRIMALVAALATPVAASTEADLQAVIRAQVAAFLDEDVVTAFGYASPAIQEIFGAPENFGRMVADGYPMIWRPSALEFLDVWSGEGRLFQRVRVQDSQGILHLFDYEMVEVDGAWRVNGVFPVTEAAPSV